MTKTPEVIALEDELATQRREKKRLKERVAELQARLDSETKKRIALELVAKKRDSVIGQAVFKRGSYSGRGVIAAAFATRGGERRFVVAHRLEGGEGELFHIYGPKELGLDEATGAGLIPFPKTGKPNER